MLTPGKKLSVFAIRTTEKGGTTWTRAGVAYINRDESVNVWLDALPIDGKLHCRTPTPDRSTYQPPAQIADEMLTAAPGPLASAGAGADAAVMTGGAL